MPRMRLTIFGIAILISGCDPTLILVPVAEPVYDWAEKKRQERVVAYEAKHETAFGQCDPPVEGAHCSEYPKRPTIPKGSSKVVVNDRQISATLRNNGIKTIGPETMRSKRFHSWNPLDPIRLKDSYKGIYLFGTNRGGWRVQFTRFIFKPGGGYSFGPYDGAISKPEWDFEVRFDSDESPEDFNKRGYISHYTIAISVITARLNELLQD